MEDEMIKRIPNGLVIEVENKRYEIVGKQTIRGTSYVIGFSLFNGKMYMDRNELLESLNAKDGWVKIIK